MGAEVALAFAAGIAAFAVVSVAVAAAHTTPVVLILIAVCIATVLAIFRYLGVAYAVPAALAAILAFDWFYIPPTHPEAFPSAESLADLRSKELPFAINKLFSGQLVELSGFNSMNYFDRFAGCRNVIEPTPRAAETIRF